ncbi:MAG: hypothetical protein DRP45_02310 [Candidatus Zixiibacteriota bacterium]|nr:MAG: hypothetical protein DRP45_02310 [candidate division Zixibacteria bacterium]
MSDFDLYSVNWQDGMLISKEHLKDQEKYLEGLARWHAASASDRYGLIRKSFGGKSALSLVVSMNGNNLQVEVARCQAVTPDGTHIDIGESTGNVVRAETEIDTATLPVYLVAGGSEKAQVGDPDPNEDLPRLPYLVSDYKLYLGDQPNHPVGSYLKIAEIVCEAGSAKLSNDYLPPCVDLHADESLSARANDLRNILETLLSLATRAYQATSKEGALPGEKTELQVAFKEAMHNIVMYMSSAIDEFVIGRNAGHPSKLVIGFKKLFRVYSTSLNLHPGLKDYLNEKLFVRELDSDVRQHMSAIDSFLLSEYNHQDIGGHFLAIQRIMETIKRLLEFVAQVKSDQLGPQAVATDMLTYQGKTYRLVEYSGCRLEQVGELSYLVIDTAEPRGVDDAVILISKDLFSIPEWTAMQLRLGLNEARGLGETDPIDIDTTSFGDKVALHPRDILKLSSVNQLTIMFRGAADSGKLSGLGQTDLMVYAV